MHWLNKSGLVTIAAAVGGVLIHQKYIAYREAAVAKEVAITKLNSGFSKLVDTQWTLNDVRDFLESLPQSDIEELGDLTGKNGADAKQLTYHLLWLSSSAFTYPFKNKDNGDYQTEILFWAAQKNGVSVSDDLSSFRIERRILEYKFEQIWDRLTPQQRTELLGKIKISDLSNSQKATLAIKSGTDAFATLSATMAFSEFAFYSTMSTVMTTTAGFLKIVLPFSAGAGAAGTACLFGGPVGWGIAIIAGTGAAVWMSAPDADKTTAFILALHTIKARQAQEIVQKIEKLGGKAPVI